MIYRRHIMVTADDLTRMAPESHNIEISNEQQRAFLVLDGVTYYAPLPMDAAA